MMSLTMLRLEMRRGTSPKRPGTGSWTGYAELSGGHMVAVRFQLCEGCEELRS